MPVISDGRRRARHLRPAGRPRPRRPTDRRPRRHRRVVAVPARRARGPLPPDCLRQPRRGPDGDARRSGVRGGDGGRRRRRAAGARRSVRSRGRASRAAASSPRSWRYDTLTSCAAWCFRAPGRCRTPTCGRGRLFVRSFAEVAPSERAFLEGFFLWIYTARAHNDGTVDQIIEEVLAFPHKQSTEDMQRFLDAHPRSRHDRSPGGDRRPDAGARRWPRPDQSPGARPRRRRADPRRPLRGDGGGIPSTLPGGAGRMERTRRRLLARG